MARNSLSIQNTRSAKNPFSLGSFGELTLRYLTGSLGPKNKVISGGYGEGEYNHWYSITLTRPGWIVLIKGGTKPKHINVSAYDLNRNPIEGRSIFDADSVKINGQNSLYFPYLDTIMSAGSDLYNTYNRYRLDKGDERYFPLEAGSYLICVSSTRNEKIDYTMALVVEFPPDEVIIALEDDERAYLLKETAIDFSRTINVISPVSVNTIISPSADVPNGFTELTCTINSGVTVTILDGSTWLIGEQIPSAQSPSFSVLAEPGNELYFDTIHDHSLSEWKDAWNATHKTDNEPFPAEFVPYVNRP